MTYAPGNHPADQPNRPDKGQKGGSCNVTACQLRASAHWFNHSTRRYYCEACATVLNRENRLDAERLFGHDLCSYEGTGPRREIVTELMPSIERSIRRVYNPPPVREDYPSRQTYRRATKDWIAQYGSLSPP